MIVLEGVSKTYDLGPVKVKALDQVSLTVQKGELVTIMGPSGSGKSTLLHVLGLLDPPGSGSYRLEGHEVANLADRELARIRNRHFGFVFQSFNLIPELTALENVMLPLLFAGSGGAWPGRKRSQRARELLAGLGLEHRAAHYPPMMSGGEQQRVAIARALAGDPDLILADEPTGNLPSAVGGQIIDTLEKLNADGVTVVMVTHDDRLGARGRRRIHLQDGRVTADQGNP